MKKTFYSLYFKHFLDFNLSLIALIVLSPFLLIVIILQILFNGLPIFFVQPRVGKDEKIFKLIKFRTMNNNKDKNGLLLPDKKRKTWFGAFLRRTSIDELPSLINIIKGDMTLVGPRPLLVEYLPFYTKEQLKRHLVRPGLTGLAQLKGRNRISWKEKFYWDIYYINHITFFFDLKLILLTVIKVFLLNVNDIDKNSSITMDKFNGK